MTAHHTPPPTRSSQETSGRIATETSVIHPDDRKSCEPPPALVLCWHCSAVADVIDPPGWVMATTAEDLGLRYAHGVCPGCLADFYTFPTSAD